MEKQSPVRRVWELDRDRTGPLVTAVILAVAGAACGMVPCFAAAKIIVGLAAGETAMAACTPPGWRRPSSAILCGQRSAAEPCPSPTRRPSAS